MEHVESALYSEERASGSAEQQQLAAILGREEQRVPYFIIVRKQQAELERTEQRMIETQRLVQLHLQRRKGVVEYITRLQKEENFLLQRWLLKLWYLTYKERKSRMEKLAGVMLSSNEDLVTPFITWRLFVSIKQVERTKTKCEEVDKEASGLANQITEVELYNESQQKKLLACQEASSELKDKCVQEQQEIHRLQAIWEATQPELLLSVLLESLELFFSLVVQSSKLWKLEVQQKMADKDVSPLLEDLDLDNEVSGEELLIKWVNLALDKCRNLAQELLDANQTLRGSTSELEAVIAREDVTNVEEDMQDCVALCCLHIMMKTERDSRLPIVEDFAPLEERDPEIRAVQVCNELHQLIPLERARLMLQPEDILSETPRHLPVFLACAFLQHSLLPRLPDGLSEDDKDESRQRLREVIGLMGDVAGKAVGEPLEDPTPLLHGAEDFQALGMLSVEQLLLRWVNVQLANVHSVPVENFGSDLQGGMALSLLIRQVAPEAYAEEIPAGQEDRYDEILAAAAKCCDFELLTLNALLDGQSDMLASFLAQLFMTRPNLEAAPTSLLAMHVMLIENVCCSGLDMLSRPRSTAEAMEFCTELTHQWNEFTLAIQTVQEATKTMKAIRERLQSFIGETLACRARGQPRVMIDAKEARELMLYSSVDQEQLSALLPKEPIDNPTVVKIEEVLRTNFRLLREVFRYYAASPGASSQGIGLGGVLKLFQDCKLRSRDLAPQHVEAIFTTHLDNTKSSETTILAHSFVEVLIQLANVKFRSSIETIPEQLRHLIDKYLRPHACQDSDSGFLKAANDPKVRKVLEKHSHELKIIFQLYATLDMSTAEAMQRINTINIKEFQMLLADTDLLDATLTVQEVEQIFEQIQQSTSDDVLLGDGPNDDGMGDDDELALSEFLDGLVAITAYKVPDPFTPLSVRLDKFLMELFASLRKHWSRKRISTQVDAMLNALQKKLR